MRLKNALESLISGDDKYNVIAANRVTCVTLINQSNAVVRVGMNNETPYTTLAIGQPIAYDAGLNSIWGDCFIKVDFGGATVKQVIVLLTKDLGEITLP